MGVRAAVIHLCVASPFEGFEEAVLYGKGPSLRDDYAVDEAAHVALNDVTPHVSTYTRVIRDPEVWERIQPPAFGVILDAILVSGRVWRECPDVRLWGAFYFDENRILGRDVRSQEHPPRTLGVGTATAALQLLAEAGVRKVHLTGFDAFFGGTLEYHEQFKAMGLSHGDYAAAYPYAGPPEVQAALIRESMQHVIERKGLEIVRVP